MNRNGIADWRERFIDVNRNRIDDRQEGYRYKMNWTRDPTCPSGVAKRNMKCVSPRKVAQEEWKRGYRVPADYATPAITKSRCAIEPSMGSIAITITSIATTRFTS
jgi:hypothetical protein